MPERIVHDLFPISERSAELGFAIFEEGMDSNLRSNSLSITRELMNAQNGLLSRMLLKRYRGILEVSEELMEEGDVDEPLENVEKSYTMGMHVGYETLFWEAYSKKGDLPRIKGGLIRTWSVDAAVHRIQDMNMLADLIGTDEGDIDKEVFLRVLGLNRFASSRTQTVLNQEPALRTQLDKYLPGEAHMYDKDKVIVRPFADGLIDVVTIFKAHHEAQLLRRTLRRRPFA